MNNILIKKNVALIMSYFILTILPCFSETLNSNAVLKNVFNNTEEISEIINQMIINNKSIDENDLKNIIDQYYGKGVLNLLTPIENSENMLQGTTFEYSGTLPKVSTLMILPIKGTEEFIKKFIKKLAHLLEKKKIAVLSEKRTKTILYKTGLSKTSTPCLNDIENVRDSFNVDCAVQIKFENIKINKKFSIKNLFKTPKKLGRSINYQFDINMIFYYSEKSLVIKKRIVNTNILKACSEITDYFKK